MPPVADFPLIYTPICIRTSPIPSVIEDVYPHTIMMRIHHQCRKVERIKLATTWIVSFFILLPIFQDVSLTQSTRGCIEGSHIGGTRDCNPSEEERAASLTIKVAECHCVSVTVNNVSVNTKDHVVTSSSDILNSESSVVLNKD